MNLKAKNQSNSRALPKSLADILGHYCIWDQRKQKSKIQLHELSAEKLTITPLYAEQFQQTLKDFGRLFNRKIKKD